MYISVHWLWNIQHGAEVNRLRPMDQQGITASHISLNKLKVITHLQELGVQGRKSEQMCQ